MPTTTDTVAALNCTFCGHALDLRVARCRGCGGLVGMSDLARGVLGALSANGYLTTAGLARHFGVGRDRVVDAFGEIEAAGIRLHRTHGLEGGAEIDEVAAAAQPETIITDLRRLLAGPWPLDARIRAGSAIARMATRSVPGQRAILAKRMRGRTEPSIGITARRLVDLGVQTGAGL